MVPDGPLIPGKRQRRGRPSVRSIRQKNSAGRSFQKLSDDTLILPRTTAAIKEGIVITKEEEMGGEIPEAQKRHGLIKGKTVRMVGRLRIMQFVGEDEYGKVIEKLRFAVFIPDGRIITCSMGLFSSEQEAVSLARDLDNEDVFSIS